MRLKDTFYGLIDSYITPCVRDGFIDQRYFVQKSPQYSAINAILKAEIDKVPTSLFDFDNRVRCKYLGYKSGNTYYRKVSSDRFIPSIKTPFLILQAKDDLIVKPFDLPREELLRNPFCFLVEAQNGGHCSFWTKNSESKEFFPYKRYGNDLVMTFFDSF